MEPRFIIYGLTDPRTGEVRYIGKSCVGLSRPRSGRYRAKCGSWIASLKKRGLRHGVIILAEFDAADGLYEREQWAIAYARCLGWRLTNMTDGGPGLVNPSESTKAKLSAAHRGRRHTPEARERMRAAQRKRVADGWRPSAETIDKMRRARLGKKQSMEAVRKTADAHRGTRMSEETRARMSKAARALNAQPERRSKLSMAQKGRALSDEHRARLSKAWERRKLNGGLEQLALMRSAKVAVTA